MTCYSGRLGWGKLPAFFVTPTMPLWTCGPTLSAGARPMGFFLAEGGVYRLHGFDRWRHVRGIRAWRPRRLPGRWPDGGRNSTVARWTVDDPRSLKGLGYDCPPNLAFSSKILWIYLAECTELNMGASGAFSNVRLSSAWRLASGKRSPLFCERTSKYLFVSRPIWYEASGQWCLFMLYSSSRSASPKGLEDNWLRKFSCHALRAEGTENGMGTSRACLDVKLCSTWTWAPCNERSGAPPCFGHRHMNLFSETTRPIRIIFGMRYQDNLIRIRCHVFHSRHFLQKSTCHTLPTNESSQLPVRLESNLLSHQRNNVFLDCALHQDPPSLKRVEDDQPQNLSFSSKMTGLSVLKLL